MLLAPGDLAVCKKGISSLVLWPTSTCDQMECTETADSTCVFVVLESHSKPARLEKNQILTNEWRKGCYLLLSSSGVKGWVGAGWVKGIA